MELILLVIVAAPALMGFFCRLYQLIMENRRTIDARPFLTAFGMSPGDKPMEIELGGGVKYRPGGSGPTEVETVVHLYVTGRIDVQELEEMVELRLRWDDGARPFIPGIPAATQRYRRNKKKYGWSAE